MTVQERFIEFQVNNNFACPNFEYFLWYWSLAGTVKVGSECFAQLDWFEALREGLFNFLFTYQTWKKHLVSDDYAASTIWTLLSPCYYKDLSKFEITKQLILHDFGHRNPGLSQKVLMSQQQKDCNEYF